MSKVKILLKVILFCALFFTSLGTVEWTLFNIQFPDTDVSVHGSGKKIFPFKLLFLAFIGEIKQDLIPLL